MNSFIELFKGRKPIIAMAHIPPLPGTPLYDEKKGIDGLLTNVKADLEILLSTDIDAIMFCNEGDRPYSFKAGYDGVAMMTRIVNELAPNDRPFGVDFLWDPQAALAIGAATDAAFMREVTTGLYESDMGIWHTDAAKLLRERRRLNIDGLAILMNISPEFASSIGSRDISAIAHSVAVSSLPDGILVSGPMAGAEPDINSVKLVKEIVPENIPVLVNTGVRVENVSAYLSVSDGIIVGTGLKQNGYTWNPVDSERVHAFLAAAEDERHR